MIQPPISGPLIGAISAVIDHSASANPARSRVNVVSSSDCDSGTIGPATSPCSTRHAISASIPGAIAHSQEAAVNSRIEATISRTGPKRVVSQPVSGSAIALATVNDVMIQVPCVGLTPRSPAMVGIDTLAMVTSSTVMKVAPASAIAPSMRSAPSNGGDAGAVAVAN